MVDNGISHVFSVNNTQYDHVVLVNLTNPANPLWTLRSPGGFL